MKFLKINEIEWINLSRVCKIKIEYNTIRFYSEPGIAMAYIEVKSKTEGKIILEELFKRLK